MKKVKFIINKPKWCQISHEEDNSYVCCKCGSVCKSDLIWQQGDGFVIHTLCRKCYNEEFGELKQKKEKNRK